MEYKAFYKCRLCNQYEIGKVNFLGDIKDFYSRIPKRRTHECKCKKGKAIGVSELLGVVMTEEQEVKNHE